MSLDAQVVKWAVFTLFGAQVGLIITTSLQLISWWTDEYITYVLFLHVWSYVI